MEPAVGQDDLPDDLADVNDLLDSSDLSVVSSADPVRVLADADSVEIPSPSGSDFAGFSVCGACGSLLRQGMGHNGMGQGVMLPVLNGAVQGSPDCTVTKEKPRMYTEISVKDGVVVIQRKSL